ncbi:ABC-2 type transport system ATP-binding protein [Halolactibacillus halophilus]|uniref:ABC transporter ATP-binding protein n=1 Tax=Halolactibacillus halophilus TaxID=306540 RepID=A0A1I5QNR2_9BACI|nr:ABC transporter ATP-binding protein [Halolactibacillus halophilus]GEM01869.1 ABC transporter ATP-binding protein [Halolactibacillus halophilus]SFP47883.1 ABC-2 type transport system ATP-binding protein [Halolactibacillus halophilus]
MLEVQGLSKSFKDLQAVKDVSLTLKEGESVGLLGPNGAGKSTTIQMMSTGLTPTSGQVIYNDKDALKNPKQLRRDLGVVPQDIALYEELSAYENLLFFGRLYGLKGKALKTKIEEVLALVGLSDRKKDRVKNYSGGMKRRINIAASLLHNPKVLIMDEPTVGIDPQSRSYILDLIKQLNKENHMTVLYTSHYMEEVEKLCDRIYIMDHGEVIASGTKSDLQNLMQEEETVWVETLEKNQAFKQALEADQTITQVIESDQGYKVIAEKREDLLGDLFDYAKVHHVKLTALAIQTPTLEDVFLHLTGRKLRD